MSSKAEVYKQIVATARARDGQQAEAEAQEAQNVTTMKTEAEVSPEGLATLAQLLADETTADKTTTADDSGDDDHR